MDTPDGRAIVRRGYDRIAERFRAERVTEFGPAERAFLRRIVDALTPGASVLDLGCGAGEPITVELAERARVVAVDISTRQLVLARRRLPTVAFVQADMGTLAFRSDSFDAVTALWSVIHLPRERHEQLFHDVATWLRPRGFLAAVIGSGDNPSEFQADWLGAQMYWSHYEADTTLGLMRAAGFVIELVHPLPKGLPSDEAGPLAVIARAPAA